MNDSPAKSLHEAAVFYLLPYVGAATAAITGTLYIAGYMRVVVITGRYGLQPGIISNSIDEMLAFGYLPLLSIGLLFIAEIAVLLLLGWMYGRVSKRIIPFWARNPINDQVARLARSLRKIPRRARLFYVAFTSLTIGFASGAVLGGIECTIADAALGNRCRADCFVFKTKDGTTIGVSLIADESRILVRDRRGVRLVPTGALTSVLPFKRLNRKSSSQLHQNASPDEGVAKQRELRPAPSPRTTSSASNPT